MGGSKIKYLDGTREDTEVMGGSRKRRRIQKLTLCGVP